MGLCCRICRIEKVKSGVMRLSYVGVSCKNRLANGQLTALFIPLNVSSLTWLLLTWIVFRFQKLSLVGDGCLISLCSVSLQGVQLTSHGLALGFVGFSHRPLKYQYSLHQVGSEIIWNYQFALPRCLWSSIEVMWWGHMCFPLDIRRNRASWIDWSISYLRSHFTLSYCCNQKDIL